MGVNCFVIIMQKLKRNAVLKIDIFHFENAWRGSLRSLGKVHFIYLYILLAIYKVVNSINISNI